MVIIHRRRPGSMTPSQRRAARGRDSKGVPPDGVELDGVLRRHEFHYGLRGGEYHGAMKDDTMVKIGGWGSNNDSCDMMVRDG